MDPHQITNSGNSRGDIATWVSLGALHSLPFQTQTVVLRKGADPSTILPFIRSCEDLMGGLKIVPNPTQ